MAVSAITVVDLALNTASDDLADADSTAIVTGADGFSVDVSAYAKDAGGRKMVFKFVADGGGDDITITAGDYPPAATSGLGNLTIALAASDVKYVVVELARFLHNDGTIKGTCAGNNNKMSVLMLPREA